MLVLSRKEGERLVIGGKHRDHGESDFRKPNHLGN